VQSQHFISVGGGSIVPSGGGGCQYGTYITNTLLMSMVEDLLRTGNSCLSL
jgi:hypothetical protein